jgi:Tol biopolymer transport system component
MAKRSLLLLWSFFTLASCQIGNSVVAISTITPIPSLTSTVTHTATLTPTQTGTPTVSPEIMRYQCLEISDYRPADHLLKGVIVYNDDNNLYAYLSNQETGVPFFFPRDEGDRLLSFSISPDGKYLMYYHYAVRTQEDRMIIITADGKSIWSELVNDYSWQWFDNERLQRVLVSENEEHTLLLFNPFTGKRHTLPADLPSSEMYTDNFFLAWYGASSPIYDPTLTRAVYGAGFHDSSNLIHPVIALWDTQSSQKIWERETIDWGDTPIWTSDGQQFLMAANLDPKETRDFADEFFAIGRDGEVRQLTHFMDYYHHVDIHDNYSLSPNGRLLAFWIYAQPSLYEEPRLAVLNLETNEVINYCIKGDAFADNEYGPQMSLWSPDSTQLLIVSRPPEDTKTRQVVVVDILHNYAAKIDADMEPQGWMVAP